MKSKNSALKSLWLIVFLGVCGGVLRGLEVALHFNWDTAFYEPFSTSFIMPLHAVISTAAALLFAYRGRGELPEYTEAYAMPGKLSATLSALSCAVLSAAGLWKLVASVTRPKWSGIIFGILTILAGLVLLMLTHAKHRGVLSEYGRFISSLPVYWSCFLLILTYMEHPVEPVIRVFAYDILAACLIALAFFFHVSRIYGKKGAGRPLFFSMAAVYFILTVVLGRAIAYLISGDTRNLLDAPFRMIAFSCAGMVIFLDIRAMIRSRERT
ncbi:MAG: hypothetical protein ACOXZM_00045 [Eubacteriales bacterium]|mgnify:FL=1